MVAVDERWLKAQSKSLSILKGAVLLESAAYDIPGYLKEVASEGRQGMNNIYGPAFGDTEEAWRDASPQAQIAAGKNIPPMLMFYTTPRMYANKFAPAFADALTKAGARSKAVDTLTLEHSEILTTASEKEHPLAQLVLRFLNGVDATKFPEKLEVASLPMIFASPACSLPNGR